jgi:acyl-CoA synthetase (AMP-forming)/AMP-acid ligase II
VTISTLAVEKRHFGALRADRRPRMKRPGYGAPMKVALTVNDFLRRAEEVYPDRVGIVDEPDQPAPSWGSLTYREMAARARAQAAGLDVLEVGPRERVAVVSQNSARLLTSFWGVAGSGRILVPINFRLNADEVSYIVDHSGARVLILDPELDDALAGVKAEYRFVIGADSDAELYRSDLEPQPCAIDEDEMATINYTSGTTARPKGVELTHRNCWLNAAQFGWHMGVSDRDVYLHTLPMFHADGWGMPFAVTGMGARHVVLRKVDGPEILRRVDVQGVTLMCGAPAVVAAVLEAAATWDGPIPGAGRTRMAVAGAPPPTRTIERMEEELGWEFVQVYGLTETSPILTMARRREEWDDLSVRERALKLGRAGAPVLGVEMDVTPDGEVLARSNVVMRGYWNQPEETAKAIVDGWFHTGDGGYIDDAHYVNISDRIKDVIISGGENVSSIEVEDTLFQHPGVAEVAVIGVPDERWGETVVALVVLRAGSAATERELIDFCRERLAHYKCPTRVEVRSELARTATGKLQKFKLREAYWGGRAKRVN